MLAGMYKVTSAFRAAGELWVLTLQLSSHAVAVRAEAYHGYDSFLA